MSDTHISENRESLTRSSCCSYPSAAGPDEDMVSSEEALHAMATITIVRIARARISLRLADVLVKWRINSRAMLLDKLVRNELVPLLTYRSSMINSYQPRPEEYIAFGEERQPESPRLGGEPEGAMHQVEIFLLRSELQDTEATWADAKSQIGKDCNDSRDGSDEASLRLDLDSASSILHAQSGAHLELSSPGISPATRRGSGPRSPTPTDFSEPATSLTTPARRGRGHAGLTLKQLSEGDRALSAAVERELRRAAELAKVKQRYERSEMRCNRAQQALQGALSEIEQLRSEVAKLKLRTT